MFVLACCVIIAALLLTDATLHGVVAQSPFGGPRPPAEPQAGGAFGWLLAQQSAFYRQISTAIRASKADGSAVWTLLGISFAYGVFHAAGPGHGKAVISSYLVANEETARRGIALSFASALLQAVVAVAVVGICAWLLNATAKTMCSAERAIELGSYGLIALFGARLVWVKGGGLIRALRGLDAGAREPLVTSASHGEACSCGHDHGGRDGHSHNHAEPAHHHHGHDPQLHGHGLGDHVHDAHCGHAHGPEPAELAGPGGWTRGIGAVFAVGLRPCSGAILVLVFALAQGLFWAGVAATFVMGLGTAITVAGIAILAVSAKGLARRVSAGRSGGGAVVLRGIEFAAAALVLLIGCGLFLGYFAAERVTCV